MSMEFGSTRIRHAWACNNNYYYLFVVNALFPVRVPESFEPSSDSQGGRKGQPKWFVFPAEWIYTVGTSKHIRVSSMFLFQHFLL